jgi:IclR family acetate operon transcriptional repressor
MKKTTDKTNSIEKALNILMAFNPHNWERGTVELSRELDLHPATVNRILMVLRGKGFVRQGHLREKFTLGPAAYQLGKSYMQFLKTELVAAAAPYLEDLCRKIQETVVLDIISGYSVIVAYVAYGGRVLPTRASVGDRLAVHAAAGGKAILAFSDPEFVSRLLNRKLHRFTASTITDLNTLKLHLKQVKEYGVGFSKEEMEIGVNGIGAVIFDTYEKPVGAVAIVGPSGRVQCEIESPMVDELKMTVAKISAELFGV